MTKMGNITVKKSEFQSVNLVISKLTAMFKVIPPYPRSYNQLMHFSPFQVCL